MPERYQLEEYMDMYDGKVVLCGANSYEEKYYLNPDFEQLPDDVKNELKIMCVLYVHDVGGILTLVFEEDGELCFEVSTEESTNHHLLSCPDDSTFCVNPCVAACAFSTPANSLDFLNLVSPCKQPFAALK